MDQNYTNANAFFSVANSYFLWLQWQDTIFVEMLEDDKMEIEIPRTYCHSYHDHKHDYHDDHHLMTIIIIIQVRESLNQATEFGAMPEDSEYPFPELIVLMGGLMDSLC